MAMVRISECTKLRLETIRKQVVPLFERVLQRTAVKEPISDCLALGVDVHRCLVVAPPSVLPFTPVCDRVWFSQDRDDLSYGRSPSELTAGIGIRHCSYP